MEISENISSQTDAIDTIDFDTLRESNCSFRFKGIINTPPTNFDKETEDSYSTGDIVLYQYISDDEIYNEFYLYIGWSQWLLITDIPIEVNYDEKK